MVDSFMANSLHIEVVYIEPGFQFSREISVEPETSVTQAIELSGLFKERPELIVEKVGIYGKVVSMNHQLVSGDRIEVYRPLVFDPKEARRKRAAQQ